MTHRTPVPGAQPGTVLVAAPGAGDGWWAGAPAVVAEEYATLLVAYRLRHGHDGHDETVVARWDEGLADAEHVVVFAGDARTGVKDPVVRRTEHGWEAFVADRREPLADVRYVAVLRLAGGGQRLFYEARRDDLSHELRTEVSPPA